MQPNAKRSRVAVKFEGIVKVLEPLFACERSHLVDCEPGTFSLPIFTIDHQTGMIKNLEPKDVSGVFTRPHDTGTKHSYVTSYSPLHNLQLGVLALPKDKVVPPEYSRYIRLKGGCYLVHIANPPTNYSEIRLVNFTGSAPVPPKSGKKKKAKGNTTKFSGSLELRVVVKVNDKWISSDFILKTKAVVKNSNPAPIPSPAYPATPPVTSTPVSWPVSPCGTTTPPPPTVYYQLPPYSPQYAPMPTQTTVISPVASMPPLPPEQSQPGSTMTTLSSTPFVSAVPLQLPSTLTLEETQTNWDHIEPIFEISRGQADDILRLKNAEEKECSFMLIRKSQTEPTLLALSLLDCHFGSVFHHRIGQRNNEIPNLWVGNATPQSMPATVTWEGFYIVGRDQFPHHRETLQQLLVEVVWEKIKPLKLCVNGYKTPTPPPLEPTNFPGVTNITCGSFPPPPPQPPMQLTSPVNHDLSTPLSQLDSTPTPTLVSTPSQMTTPTPFLEQHPRTQSPEQPDTQPQTQPQTFPGQEQDTNS